MPHVKPLLVPDMTAETARMSRAVKVRTAYEAEWWRDDSAGGWPRLASRLRGPWGMAMRRAMENTFASGATTIQVEGGGTRNVRGFRWVQLEEKLDPTLQPLKEMAIRLGLLYRPPPGRPALDVNGDIAVPSWQWLAKRADLDGVCIRRQAWMIGRQCAAVRPTLREFVTGQHYPPGLVVLGADQIWAVEDPVRPGVAVVVGELLPSGGWLIWDCADPRRPYWGEWRSVAEWAYGGKPYWMQEGWDYPWRWRLTPFVPVIITRWDATASELLPADLRDVEAVRSLTLQRMWIDVVGQAGSYNKAVLLSGNKMDGLAQSMLDPTVIQAFSGAGPWDLKIVPHSLDAYKILIEAHAERYLEWARRYDPSHEVRRETGAQSGYALSIRMTGQYLLRQQMEARARATDTAIVIALAVTMNYLNMSGQTGIRGIGDDIDWDPDVIGQPRPEFLIPETTPDLGYPHLWRPEERAERRVELDAAVNAHMEYPEALWLFDRQMEDDRPDGPNWLKAGASISGSLVAANRYGTGGYGVAWKDLWMGADRASASLTIEKQAPVDGETAGGALMVGQIQGAQLIIADVRDGRIPREVGKAQLISLVGLQPDAAESALGTLGAGFTPAKPEGYDPALRESAATDVQASAAAVTLKALGIPEAEITAFLALRGVTTGAVATTMDAATATTHIPPTDVSRTASKGLRLRDEKVIGLGAGKGAAGMTSQDKRLLARARKLKDGDEFSRGDVLDLDVWLEAHTTDRDGDTGWENEAEPSAAWVEWLTQGGDPGLAWTNATLAPPEVAPTEETSAVKEDAPNE